MPSIEQEETTMPRFMQSMLLAAMTITLGAGAANAAPRNDAARSEARTHVEHGRNRDGGDRDGDRDHRGRYEAREREREERVWRGERWVTVYEPETVFVDAPMPMEEPMTAWDFEQRAVEERSEANQLRGDARWDRMFLLLVPADNAERRARYLDERAAADDAEARALERDAR